MLIEFSVANFRSFRDRVTLSLEAEPQVSEPGTSVDARNVVRTAHGDLLRVVGVYGANAGGKSNLVKAMAMLGVLVVNSAREGQAGDALPAQPFRLDAESVKSACEMEIVFTQDGDQVRYGVAFTAARVVREWLFVRQAGQAVEERWFERTDDVYEVGGAWDHDPGVEKKTRAEALHLSVASAWNHPQAQRLMSWFKSQLWVSNPRIDDWPVYTSVFSRDEEHWRAIRELIKRLDFGIQDLQLVPSESAKGSRLVAIRQGVAFDLRDDESDGTAKSVALAGIITRALARGGVLVIDELDARLHTLLAKQLVELFQDAATNPRDAQLIFTSHDTNLLTRTLFRRDQLWFVEKSHRTYASDLYSLAEFRLEDGASNPERDYLQGKYGAIPFFGNLSAILGETLRQEE